LTLKAQMNRVATEFQIFWKQDAKEIVVIFMITVLLERNARKSLGKIGLVVRKIPVLNAIKMCGIALLNAQTMNYL